MTINSVTFNIITRHLVPTEHALSSIISIYTLILSVFYATCYMRKK